MSIVMIEVLRWISHKWWVLPDLLSCELLLIPVDRTVWERDTRGGGGSGCVEPSSTALTWLVMSTADPCWQDCVGEGYERGRREWLCGALVHSTDLTCHVNCWALLTGLCGRGIREGEEGVAVWSPRPQHWPDLSCQLLIRVDRTVWERDTRGGGGSGCVEPSSTALTWLVMSTAEPCWQDCVGEGYERGRRERLCGALVHSTDLTCHVNCCWSLLTGLRGRGIREGEEGEAVWSPRPQHCHQHRHPPRHPAALRRATRGYVPLQISKRRQWL